MDKVLAFCNKIRAELNSPPALKLEKGARGSGWNCPVARTIGNGVLATHNLVYYWTSRPSLYVWPTPPEVKDFIKDFDRGLFPELEVK